MIQKPTVLILGAGASEPYGYPLGAGLVERIVALTSPGPPMAGFRQLLHHHSPLREQVADFHSRLLRSDTGSIDDFLESNPDHRDLGKLCIAAALTVWGPKSNTLDARRHWYKYLWERLRQGAPTSRQFGDNQLRIITYNYERSFERYFASVLLHTYPDLAKAGPNGAEALRVKAIPIVHLHGTLGEVADQAPSVPDVMMLNTLEFYKQAAAGIQIIHDVQPTTDYATAQEWLREAKVICFLGFGYHPTNIKRLDLLDQVRGHAGLFCGGTALGMEQSEVLRAETLLGIGGSILVRDVDALMYLRRYAPLE